jgi:hypothetical protein
MDNSYENNDKEAKAKKHWKTKRYSISDKATLQDLVECSM